jgi:hypothetical protein
MEAMTMSQDPPWSVREEWARGLIEKRPSFFTLAAVWGFALFWNGFVVGMAALAMDSGSAEPSAILLASSPFLVVGLFLLLGVIKSTLRDLKFGASSFKMTKVPGVIGGHLEGIVHLSRSLSPEGPATLVLTCEEGFRSADQSKSAHHKMIWRDEKTTPVSPSQRDIPVDFQIPYDSHETIPKESDQVTWFTWTLHVNVPTRGVDFAETFEVPVFMTKESDPTIGQPVAVPGNTRSQLLPSSSRIRLERSSRGAVIRLPVRGILIWMAAPLLLVPALKPISQMDIFQDAPFWMVLGGFFLAYIPYFLLFLVSLVMTPSRIELQKGEARIRTGAFGVGLTRTLQAAAITDVLYEIQPAGTRYNVMILSGDDTKAVAYNLRRQSEAQWLVARIRETVGIGESGQQRIQRVLTQYE